MICVNDITSELGSLHAELTCKDDIQLSTSEPLQNYLSYYGLEIASSNWNVRHIYGTFNSGDYVLSGHLYIPENYTAVMVCAHGYMNHVAQYKNLIKYYVDCGLAVALFDMPGHGLSTGRRGDIEDFQQYTDALKTFIEIVTSQLHGPYYLTGFSMGSATVINYLLTEENIPFEKCILSAPLVRSAGWNISVICTNLYKPFVDSVPRMYKPNTSSKEYNEFNAKRDYLHVNQIPLSWVGALHRWNKKIQTCNPTDHPVLIVQGTRDSVVEHKYNVGFLQTKFTNNQVVYIKGARHELFNETKPMRTEVFRCIDHFINLD